MKHLSIIIAIVLAVASWMVPEPTSLSLIVISLILAIYYGFCMHREDRRNRYEHNRIH